MSDSDKTVPHPPGIHPECLVNPDLCHRWNYMVSVYDPETLVGGLFNELSQEWILYYPIGLEMFVARTAHAVDFLAELRAQAVEEPRH